MLPSKFRFPTQEDLPFLQQVLEESRGRLDELCAVRDSLSHLVSLHITLCYPAPEGSPVGSTRYLDQDLIPFNLSIEVAALVNNSIGHYRRTCDGLSQLIEMLKQ